MKTELLFRYPWGCALVSSSFKLSESSRVPTTSQTHERIERGYVFKRCERKRLNVFLVIVQQLNIGLALEENCNCEDYMG